VCVAAEAMNVTPSAVRPALAAAFAAASEMGLTHDELAHALGTKARPHAKKHG
jgi:hypothetical protein